MAKPPSPTHSQLPPVPSSPTYSFASTANQLSSYNLPLPPPPRPSHAVLTKADLDASQDAYADLLSTAKAYRQAMATLSTAASAFGAALEACARLKEARAEPISGPAAPNPASSGPGPSTGPSISLGASVSPSFAASPAPCTADLLMSSSGVHHLIANHQQILSETVYRSFEVPLLHELDRWRRDMDDEDERYRRDAAARSREIRRLEKEGLRLHRQQRRRHVAQFRDHLVTLTSHLDGLTTLHADHARTLLRESQDTSLKIVDASCSLVRAEVDIFESLARKGWTGGGLDDLLEKGQDLFANDDDGLASTGVGITLSGAGASASGGGAAGGEGAKLFSILPPSSILADAGSDQSRGRTNHGRADSLLVDTDRYQSLTGAVGTEQQQRGDQPRPPPAAASGDNESIFSEFNQSRGVRPFSPQPIRRRPTDVIMDPDTLPNTEEDDEQTQEQEQEQEQNHDRERSGADSEGEISPGARDDEGDDAGGHEPREETEEPSNREGAFNDGDGGEDGASPWKDEGLSPDKTAEGPESPPDANPSSACSTA